MSILFKSFFMNNWGRGTGVPTGKKTWLQADKPPENWQNNEGVGSGFLSPKGAGSDFLSKGSSSTGWLNTEGGTPDFKEEGEETYIE